MRWLVPLFLVVALIGCGSEEPESAASGPSDAQTSDAVSTDTPAAPDEGASGDDITPDVAAPPECAGPDALVFLHVNVLPLDHDSVLEDTTVIVQGGTLCAIGDSAAPEGAQVVDGTGKTLLPGLVDMHIHLNHEADILLYVAHGVTTVRNMWGRPWHLDLRDRIVAAEVLGPELHTSGPIMDGNPPVWPGSEVVATPAAAKASVQAQAASTFSSAAKL